MKPLKTVVLCMALAALVGACATTAPPRPAIADAEPIAKSKNCVACHAMARQVVGPAFFRIAQRYRGDPNAVTTLEQKILYGGAGAWGAVPMPAMSNVTPEEARSLSAWILSLEAPLASSPSASGLSRAALGSTIVLPLPPPSPSAAALAQMSNTQLKALSTPAGTRHSWNIANLRFTSPLALEVPFTGDADDSHAGTAADPYRLRMHHLDSSTNTVAARVEVVAFKLPENVNFAVYSVRRVRQSGFEIVTMPSRQRLGLALPMATGYVVRRQASPTLWIKSLITHFMIDDKLVELELSTHEDSFARFEPLFRELVASVGRLS